jgi:MFS family permease
MHAFSVILVALLEIYGLSRAELSGIFSLYMLVFFGSGVLVGPLLDRFGPRKVIPLGALLAGLGLGACSLISSPFQLYFTYGLVSSLGSCCVGWIPNSLVISNWFVRRRGTAVGVVMCGNGLGILVFVPLTQFIVDLTGWRGAFLAMAGLVVLLAGPLNAFFQCARPADKNLAPDGDAPRCLSDPKKLKATVTHYPVLWTLADALRSRSFWLMCAAFFCNPFATFAIVLHQVALVVEKGFDPMYVASMIGALGIFTTGGRFLGGTLSDYIGREKAYTLFMSFAALAVLSLLFLSQERAFLLPVYVVLMGLGLGVGGAMFPTMIADMFPGPSLGRIMGVCAAFGGVGAAFGSWLAGYLYDLSGSYASSLYCIEMALAGAVAAVWLAAPRRARNNR